MKQSQACNFRKHAVGTTIAFLIGALITGTAFAGGVLVYEVGTADVGLASAG